VNDLTMRSACARRKCGTRLLRARCRRELTGKKRRPAIQAFATASVGAPSQADAQTRYVEKPIASRARWRVLKHAVNYVTLSRFYEMGLTASKLFVVSFRHDPNRSGKGRWVTLRQPRVDLRSQAMKTLVSRFVKDQSGATAIEYGLIAAGISVAIIAVVQGLGTNLKATFSSVSSALQ
jgi:pilus assembly protein Flp/PilA